MFYAKMHNLLVSCWTITFRFRKFVVGGRRAIATTNKWCAVSLVRLGYPTSATRRLNFKNKQKLFIGSIKYCVLLINSVRFE